MTLRILNDDHTKPTELLLTDERHGDMTLAYAPDEIPAIACEHWADCDNTPTYILTIHTELDTFNNPDIYALCRDHAAQSAGYFLTDALLKGDAR